VADTKQKVGCHRLQLKSVAGQEVFDATIGGGTTD
jgi:hypothetical protein